MHQSEFLKIIEGASSIGIAGHYHPDGDCTGSTLGLYNFIHTYYPKKYVQVFLEDIPDVFKFLKGADKIKAADEYTGENFDVFFALDCSDGARLDKAYSIFKASKETVCIDHHLSNDSFARINHIIPDASSTSELVCALIKEDMITKDMAECFYLGIVHDTGVFQYSATSPKTMRIAGVLMNTGIDYPWIIDYTYYEKTFAQNKLLGLALTKAMLYDQGRIIATVLTKEDFLSCNATKKDTEGIVNQLRITKDCEVAIFLYENENKTHKVSLRTKGDINLADIAKSYGGGGHAKAAGCTVGTDAQREIEGIIEKIKEKRIK